MNFAEQRQQFQTQIDGFLRKPSMTASERKQCDALLSKVADIRAAEARQERLDAATAETLRGSEADRPEYMAAKIERAFQRYLRGDASELRTYVPLSTAAGALVPQSFSKVYGERLKSFSGIREVANVITSTSGDPLKNPFSDDSANVGERLAENAQVSLANPTFSSNVFGAFRYASKGVQYSASLQTDAGIDLTAYLSKIFAQRIGRITNTEFTLGAIGGPSGVIPNISNVVTAGSPTDISLSDLLNLQETVDSAYHSGAVYMFNSSVERALKGEVDSNGARRYPEMNDRKLLGYAYVINEDMADIAASAKTVMFGNFKLGVAIREVVPSLLVSAERFAEANQLYASLRHDQDCLVVDANALSLLQQHA
jgi:HK97 family phage major capsid protein